MTLSVGLRQRNVDLSIFKLIQDRFANAAPYSTRTFFGDSLADPTARSSLNTALAYWVECRIVARGAGQKVPTVLQVDVYYQTGDPGDQATSDEYGHKATSVGDDFVAAMTPCNAGFTVYDFATPSTPVATSEWLLIRNSRGQQGWPEERRPVDTDRGLHRHVLTYHVWHRQDLQGVQGYF